MDANYTNGELAVQETGLGINTWIVANSGDGRGDIKIARVQHGNLTKPEIQANAQLLESSKKLLELVKRINDHYTVGKELFNGPNMTMQLEIELEKLPAVIEDATTVVKPSKKTNK